MAAADWLGEVAAADWLAAAAAHRKEEGGHIDFCQLARMKGLRPKLNRSLLQFINRFEI